MLLQSNRRQTKRTREKRRNGNSAAHAGEEQAYIRLLICIVNTIRTVQLPIDRCHPRLRPVLCLRVSGDSYYLNNMQPVSLAEDIPSIINWFHRRHISPNKTIPR
jgi:hypothetical protein